MEINGIPKGKLVIQPAALGKLINSYTKEAGVRSLERNIGRICRKTARALMEEGKDKVVVTSRNISRFLGKERYDYLMANEKNEIGIARGLAWTQVGGDTLQIEVNVMPGKGELLLTGQLGDVMKESAQAGISYIRSVADEYGIDAEFFRKKISMYISRKVLFQRWPVRRYYHGNSHVFRYYRETGTRRPCHDR